MMTVPVPKPGAPIVRCPINESLGFTLSAARRAPFVDQRNELRKLIRLAESVAASLPAGRRGALTDLKAKAEAAVNSAHDPEIIAALVQAIQTYVNGELGETPRNIPPEDEQQMDEAKSADFWADDGLTVRAKKADFDDYVRGSKGVDWSKRQHDAVPDACSPPGEARAKAEYERLRQQLPKWLGGPKQFGGTKWYGVKHESAADFWNRNWDGGAPAQPLSETPAARRFAESWNGGDPDAPQHSEGAAEFFERVW